MSNQPLSVSIEIEGLELLSQALINAPETVNAALSDAGQQAIGILGPAVDSFTHVDTGFLLSNNEFSLESVFDVRFANFTPYASFQEADNQFVTRGVESVQDEVEQVYELAMDQVAIHFGSGR